MKRKIATLLVMLTVASAAFCSINYEKYNASKFVSILDHEEVTYDDVVKVVDEYVPAQCKNAFLHYTQCETEEKTLQLMIQLLAVGQWESGWKVTISPENKNGTVDLGYLALNSANINDAKFMSKFGPNIEDGYVYNAALLDEYYLITCIKFYKYLYSRYGEDAAYCYNAGERRYLRETIPTSTYTYKKRVSEYVEMFVQKSVEESQLRIEFEDNLKNINNCVKLMFVFNDKSKFNENVVSVKSRETDKSMVVIARNYELERFIWNDKNRRMIDSVLNTAWIPNTEFICIGYIRKYGNQMAPVFKSKYTGERIVC